MSTSTKPKMLRIYLCTFLAALVLGQMEEVKGPKILIEPRDEIVDVENGINTASFGCTAEGDGELQYEWRHNGDVISGGSSYITISGGQLRITNTQIDRDEGTYQCWVTNEVGTVFSRFATLSFTFVNSFTLRDRETTTTEEFTSAVLRCNEPDSFPGLKYQWQKDSGNGIKEYISGDGRIRVGGDGSLYFANTLTGSFNDDGDYYCEIRNSYSNPSGASTKYLSPKIPLTVQQSRERNYAPQVMQRIGPHNVLKGDTVTLQCFFGGRPTPTLSWTRSDGSSLPSSSFQTDHSQELVIPNVQVEDAGIYRCTSYNSVQEGISDEGQLTVRSKPEWTANGEIVDQNGDIGGEVMWTCEAESTEDITYTWYRNGVEIQGSTKYLLSNGQKSLTIQDLQETDDAMFQCKAENQFGMILSTGELNVRAFEPVFYIGVNVAQPAALGHNATLSCKPEAAPKARIVWQRQNSVEQWEDISSTNKYFIDDNAGDLIIMDVHSGDSGMYRCEASNDFGTTTSTGSIVVKEGVTLFMSPEDQTIRAGKDSVVKCEATADDTLELAYTWLFNGHPLHLEDHSNHHDNKHYDMDIEMLDLHGNLVIKHATMYQEGEYTCVVRSAINEISASASIRVQGPPGAPYGIRIQDGSSTATSVTLYWSPGRDGHSIITSYRVEAMTNHIEEWLELRRDIPPTAENDFDSVTLNNLSPWSVYEFRVIAVNSFGAGEASEPSSEFTTPPGAPSTVPSNLGGGGGREGQLRVTWQPLDQQEWNAPSIKYKIYWERIGSEGLRQSSTVDNGTVGVYEVEGVATFVEYTVQIQAINDFGEGPMSNAVNIFSYQEAPNLAPTKVRLSVQSAMSVQVSWNAINIGSVQGQLNGYKIAYWKENMPESSARMLTTSGTGTVKVVQNLNAYTQYKFRVYAYTAGGKGPGSTIATARTYKSAPLNEPDNVKVLYGEKYNQLIVKWDKISTGSNEEKLQGYMVCYWPVGTFEEDANTVEVPAPTTQVMLDRIYPDHFYLIKVKGYSKGGVGAGQNEPIRFENSSKAARQSTSSASIVQSSFLAFTLLLQLTYLLSL